MAIPLLIQVVFHPRSDECREIARAIHEDLNDDPVVPGLHIPTRFTPEDEEHGLPPTGWSPLGLAERVFVVVLVDHIMKVKPAWPTPDGRELWGSWVAGLWKSCEGSKPSHRCVPFQISEHAHPLHPDLKEVSFPRAFDAPDKAKWVKQRLNIELVRFLNGEEASRHPLKAQAPIKLFISHTKEDLKRKPKAVKALLRLLKKDQPVDTWFDSGDIPGGSSFARQITEGVKHTAMLAVLTDAYATREWCRKELLLAKREQRPVVVLNAIQEREVRSFPYAGNVPAVQWSRNAPQQAVDLLIKETLRQLHARLVLEELQKRVKSEDRILTTPPELLTIFSREKKANSEEEQATEEITNRPILYPDPPLSREEQLLLDATGVKVSTPLQRFAAGRPLKDLKVALSLSESHDQIHHGFDLLHLNQIAMEISRYLLLAGASLYYGGHVGEKGFTIRLFELVKSYPAPGIEPVKQVVNHLGWPLPMPDEDARAPYEDGGEIRPLPRPVELSTDDDPVFLPEIKSYFPASSPIRRFGWARGMTEMRELQTSEVQARVVLGGKAGPTITASPTTGAGRGWYSSRIPGVLEEILASMKHNESLKPGERRQPIYLVGGFGGCARLAGDVILGRDRREMSWDFQKDAPFAPEMRQLYADRGLGWWSYEDMAAFMRKDGLAGLHNGLTEDENRELLVTTDLDRIVELLLTGLKATAPQEG